jgi:hypothetical protein
MCLITDNSININWCDAVVWAERKAPKSDRIVKSACVKFTETGGDKKKALELAIERLLQ